MKTTIDNIFFRSQRCLTSLTAILFGCLMLCLSSGCTRNNGDIGEWFSKWQIMEMRVNGEPEKKYEQQFFLEFQNDIVRLVWVAPTGYDRDTYYCFGTWQQPSDNTLLFDFTHRDDNSGRLFYAPFNASHFPGDIPFNLTLNKVAGKCYSLKYLDETTATEYTYLIQKR